MALEQEHLFMMLGDIQGNTTTGGFKWQVVL